MHSSEKSDVFKRLMPPLRRMAQSSFSMVSLNRLENAKNEISADRFVLDPHLEEEASDKSDGSDYIVNISAHQGLGHDD